METTLPADFQQQMDAVEREIDTLKRESLAKPGALEKVLGLRKELGALIAESVEFLTTGRRRSHTHPNT